MHMVGEIPGEKEALEALKAPYDAAIALRNTFPKEAAGTYQEGIDSKDALWNHGHFANTDPAYTAAQDEVMRLAGLRDAANRSYFRLNIWGMGSYRDVMELIGMGHWSDQPAFPEPEEFGFTSREAYWAASETVNEGGGLDYDHGYEGITLTQEMLDAATKTKATFDAVLAAHPGETPGIPLWKFGSNDGWHVTPVECSSALQIFGEWLIDGYIGPDSFDQKWTWQDALDSFRKAERDERKIIITNAAIRHQMQEVKVGHAPFSQEETDDRQTQFDVLVEDYWLQWLQYLQDGIHAGGFKVH
jgi:hypothetical protein